MGGCPLPAEACKRVGNTNTTYKVFHQRRLCDLLPRKKAFHWKPKVGGACISSQMLNLAFQWTANLSVEKGFGVTAQSLLPAEGAFARNQSLPIPQLVQYDVGKTLLTDCLAGLPIPQLVQYSSSSSRFVSSLAGLPIPQLVQSVKLPDTPALRLAGLPIPQLVQS